MWSVKSSRLGFKVRGPVLWSLESFEAGARLTFSINKLNWNGRVDVSSVVDVSRIVDLSRGKPHSFQEEAADFVTNGKTTQHQDGHYVHSVPQPSFPSSPSSPISGTAGWKDCLTHGLRT